MALVIDKSTKPENRTKKWAILKRFFSEVGLVRSMKNPTTHGAGIFYLQNWLIFILQMLGLIFTMDWEIFPQEAVIDTCEVAPWWSSGAWNTMGWMVAKSSVTLW